MQNKKEIPSDIIVKLFLIISVLFGLFLSSCSSQFHLSTLNNDPVYGYDVVIPVSKDTKVDTINSFSDLKWKLRTDFNFRWDFAQYAMNQPYSWYWNNPRLDGIWRPYNRFDVYFHSHWFWTDWAWNYPFNYHSWGWYNWNRPYHFYGWNRPYRPWNNVIWGSNYNNYNVAFVNGRRGSNLTNYNNRTISNSISTRYNNPRNSVNEENINRIVNEFRENGLNVRVINNSNNDQIIRNNSRTNWSSQSSNNGRGSWNRQNVSSKPTVPRLSNPVQSGQIYRGSGSSVLQQTRSSVQSNSQGRNGGGGRQN